MASETILITGASSGIGLELAKQFAAGRSNLVLVARNGGKLEELAGALRQENGIEVEVMVQDLADPGAPPEICRRLAERSIEVDVLVNNAGFGALGQIAELETKRQIDMIQVNVATLAHLTRLLLPPMIERRRGGILNVASTAAFQPGPGNAVYFATKAFVLSFTEALAEELAGSGVTVTCLAPGPTETGFGAVSGMEHTRAFRMGLMDAESVAGAGYRGFRAGKVLVVPGLRNKLTAFSVRFAPRSVVRKVAKWLQATT